MTFAATALVLAALGSAEQGPPAPTLGPTLPPLRVLGAPVQPMRLGSHGGALLSAAMHEARTNAQRGAQQPATAARSGAGDSGAGAASSGTDAPAEAAPAEEEEVDIGQLRVRSTISRVHRGLGIATVASVGVTTILGTILVVNQGTLFSPRQMMTGANLYLGACDTGGGVACGEMTTIHRISSIVSVSLYATTGGFALAMPDPERVNRSDDRRGTRLRVHKALAWAHLTGMVLQPLLGIFAVSPNLVGLGSPSGDITAWRESVNTYQATMRTVHEIVGFTTFAALAGAMVVELIP